MGGAHVRAMGGAHVSRDGRVRKRRAALAVAMTATLCASLSPTAFASSEVECDGTIGKTTVEEVVVPDGATCHLMGTTVEKNLVVGTGSTLVTHDAELLGAVQATKEPHSVRIINTDVDGNIHVRGATGTIVIGDSTCRIDPAAGNNIHLKDNLGPIAICMMTIEGNLHVIGSSERVRILRNVVGNNLHARENTGKWLRLRENKVGTNGIGNMDIDENGNVMLRMNTVSNHLVCRDNKRVVQVGNSADGDMRDQCG